MENFQKDYAGYLSSLYRLYVCTDKLIKDRGDNSRKIVQIQKEKAKYEPDQGDSLRIKPSEKTSESDKGSKIKREYVKHEPFTRQSEYEKKANGMLDRRRGTRDKYTVKNYVVPDVSKHSNHTDLVRDSEDISSNTQKHTEAKDQINFNQYTRVKSPKVPEIRTITSNNGAKVYKAVTFTAPKLDPVTPLEINIPKATIKKTRIPKFKNQNEIKKTSVKPDSKRNKTSKRKSKRGQIKQESSPILIEDRDMPPKEVAKWAPNCIDKHTKPYYEAWIDTTLAAISKNTENNKFVDKQNSLRTFRRGLERIENAELAYNYRDEHYTGKIKVNHK